MSSTFKIWGPDGPTDLPEATWQVLNEHKGNLGLVAALKGTALGLLADGVFSCCPRPSLLAPRFPVPLPAPCNLFLHLLSRPQPSSHATLSGATFEKDLGSW